MRVGDDEARLILAETVQWGVCLLVLLIVEDGVTLREGTTLDILTGHSDVVTLETERTECKSLGGGHVDVLALVDSLGAVGQDSLQVLMNIEIFWWVSNLVTNKLECSVIDAGRQMRENFGGKFLG